MITTEWRPSNWRQFSVSSLLLLFAVVAAFLAGRGSAHREMLSEIATLRSEIAAKKSTPNVLTRMATSRNFVPARSSRVRFAGLARLGPVAEQSTQANGSARFISLPPGKLQWSHAMPRRTGYFYFKAGGEGADNAPQWQFARSPFSSIEQFNGRSFATRFGGPDSSEIGANGTAFPVAVGELWLARPVDKTDFIYAIKLVRQEEHEAMTVKWAELRDERTKD